MKGIKPFACPEMLSALKNANSILLCGHVFPDGDAIGSVLAMGMALKAWGKDVTMACEQTPPAHLRFLPGAEEFVLPEALKGKQFDAVLAIDVADPGRMGGCFSFFSQAPVTLQIDHHATNPGYAMHNLVDGDASASGCLICRALLAMDVPITPEMARCLYAAISTDTGNFCFDNTNAETFACASLLMESGLPLNETARPLHLLREEPHVRLLGQALLSLRRFGNGKCACMRLSYEDYLAAGAAAEHTDKIVNYAMDLSGVEIAYLADEREKGACKVSLRAQPPRNVAAIARKFGGGGHVLAAGCRFELPVEEACRLLEEEILKQIEEQA